MEVSRCFRFMLPVGAVGLLFCLHGCAPQMPKGSAPVGEAFAKAFEAARQNSNTPPAAAAANGAPAYINVAALAARHPAWKLADVLEKQSAPRLAFSAVPAPLAPRPIEFSGQLSGAPLRPFPTDSNLPRPTEKEEPITGSPGYERPPQRVTARAAQALEEQARTRQDDALSSFLDDVAARQRASRDDEKRRLKVELEDEIEAAQRLTLENLQPAQPSPALQLEMTNLRIALLPNAPSNDAERERARARLEQLEAQWRAELREQENARLAELRRIIEKMPLEMREAGLQRIEAQLQTQAVREAAQRGEVSKALRERIAAGFNAQNAAPLSIGLPGASLPPQIVQATSTPGVTVEPPSLTRGTEKNPTLGALLPSARAFAAFSGRPQSAEKSTIAVSAASGSRSQRAAELRRQALQEAQRWAQAIARRRGWQLKDADEVANEAVNEAAAVPDRTREALQLLNL